VTELDRVQILRAVVPALQEDLRDWRPETGADEAATGRGQVVAQSHGVLAGLAVAREALSRVGVRMREVRRDGDVVEPGESVAEVGGPVRAIEAAGGTALRFLSAMSRVATRGDRAERSDLPSDLTDYALQVGERAAAAPKSQPAPAPGGKNGIDFAIEVEA
jgi:nicotinate-nucleotide pyrophosphorylase